MAATVRPATAVHFALTVSSEANAKAVFEDLFGMPRLREFPVDGPLTEALFGRTGEPRVLVYDAGPVTLEVFVDPAVRARRKDYDHLCLTVEDRERLTSRAAAIGVVIRRGVKGGREIVFLEDGDGNQYEIKTPS